MRLAAGDNLGPYEIVAPIGKGGMGEVYRGTDTRLGRPVAIKVSVREFNDRFEREAHAISALNHPNVCTLYDVGPNYLVMELVEGELLSKLIERGPLPLDKALSYAVQIADALAAAHAKGIVHRDLKPGNIIVTRNGIKVLDFGLAKLSTDKPSPESAANIETVTAPITRAGTVLGTLYYMAPEQVEGKEADERSDIFSFGVVLYETIAGQRPFTGDTQAAVLASILRDQPTPLSQRQPSTPRALDRVVRRCLEKKPEDRWSSALDLKRTLELIDLDAPPLPASTASASVPIPVQAPPPRSRWLWPGVIGAIVLLALAAGTAWWFKPGAPTHAMRFQVTLPENVNFSEYVSVSPDGHKLLFNATGDKSGLWIHDLDTLEWRRLEGTEGAVGPFWSPDSRYLGFSAGNSVKKIDLSGGPVQTICTIPTAAGSGTWRDDGLILFGSLAVYGRGPIYKVSASGGSAVQVTAMEPKEFDALPSFLPDGKHFLYLRTAGVLPNTEVPANVGIFIGSLDAKPAEQSKKRVLATSLGVSYVNGNLFFMRDDTLMVQPFDTSKLQLRGEAVPVAEHVAISRSIGIFSVSRAGVLAYRSGGTNTGEQDQATWFDRQGKPSNAFPLQPTPDDGMMLSPDASRAATRGTTIVGTRIVIGDVWLLDLARGVRSQLTFHHQVGSSPIWSRDGRRIFYAAGNPADTIYEKPADGTGEEKELLKQPGERLVPDSVSRDGRYLIYDDVLLKPKPLESVWLLRLDGSAGAGAKPVPLLKSEFLQGNAALSPDDRWIAYLSNESGRSEVYVRPFFASGPSLGDGKWRVSEDGAGTRPLWRGDGKEIFFGGPKNAVMAVEVNGSGAAFQVGTPTKLFTAPEHDGGWDVTPDGKRFLMSVRANGVGGQTPITVVLNWQADMKR